MKKKWERKKTTKESSEWRRRREKRAREEHRANKNNAQLEKVSVTLFAPFLHSLFRLMYNNTLASARARGWQVYSWFMWCDYEFVCPKTNTSSTLFHRMPASSSPLFRFSFRLVWFFPLLSHSFAFFSIWHSFSLSWSSPFQWSTFVCHQRHNIFFTYFFSESQ